MLAPPERISSESTAEPIREGERNSTLAPLAGTLRCPGMTAEAIAAALLVENERRCDPPLPDDEVRKIARSIARYSAADSRDTTPARAIAPVPFPVAVIPAPLRSLVEEAAAAHGVPPDFIAVPLLARAGGAMGRSHRIEIKPGFVEFPHLWVAVVAPPGTGKTPAQATARRAIDELQDDARGRYERDLAEAELAEWHAAKRSDRGRKPEIRAKPRMEAVFTTDATTEAIAAALQVSPGFTFIRDELVGWVKSYDAYRSGRGGDRQTWLSMWSAQPIKVDRKGADPIYVTKPVVSVVGGVQPAMLAQLAEEAGRQGEFLERILYSYPDAHPASWTEASVRQATQQAAIDVFRALRPDQPAGELIEESGKERVHLSAAAKALWVTWYSGNAARIEGAPGLLAGVYSKLSVHLARITLILHCWTHPRNPPDHRVSADTMNAAIDLAEYFRAHAHRVMAEFGVAPVLPHGGLATRCLRVLRDAGDWVTGTELNEALGGHVPAAQYENALRELARLNLVQSTTAPAQGARGGRPRKLWRVRAEKPDLRPNGRVSPVSPVSPQGLRVAKMPAIVEAVRTQCQVCGAPVAAYLPDGTPVCDSTISRSCGLRPQPVGACSPTRRRGPARHRTGSPSRLQLNVQRHPRKRTPDAGREKEPVMAGMLRKRGKHSWEVRIELGRDPVTGKRRFRHRTVRGTMRDAERVLGEAMHQRDTGMDIAPNRVTLEDYLRQWLRDYAAVNVAPSTLLRYAQIVDRLRPRLGSVRVHALRPAHIQEAYARLLDDGLAASTVLHHHRVLRAALQHALRWQLIARNPADAVTPPRAEDREMRALTPEEVRHLLAACHDPQLRAVIHVAVTTGLRLGELLGLRWGDVDLDGATATIRRSAQYLPGDGRPLPPAQNGAWAAHDGAVGRDHPPDAARASSAATGAPEVRHPP